MKHVRIIHAGPRNKCMLGHTVDVKPPRGKRSLTYQCKACRRRICWCNGAADDRPNHCDACWMKAEKREGARNVRRR